MLGPKAERLIKDRKNCLQLLGVIGRVAYVGGNLEVRDEIQL